MRVKLADKNRAAIIAIAAQRVGWKNAVLVMDTVVGWEMTVRKYHRPITAEDFADNWALSNATAYRRLDLFREAFPEVRFPHDLMQPLLLALAEHEPLPPQLGWAEGLLA